MLCCYFKTCEIYFAKNAFFRAKVIIRGV